MFVVSFFVTELIVTGILATALVAYLLMYRIWYHARVMADTPTSTIRAASQGRAEIIGRIPQEKPLKAPLSGEPCAFWRLEVVVERKLRSNRHLPSLRAIAYSSPDFIELNDNTGSCFVAVQEAMFKIYRNVEKRQIVGRGADGLAKHFPQKLRPIINQVGVKDFVEHRIPMDADIYAIGLFESLPSNKTPFDNLQMDKQMSRVTETDDVHLQVAKETREQLKAQWRARMRQLEGVQSDDLLAGTHTVHTLRADGRPNRRFALIVSDLDQVRLAKKLMYKVVVAALTGTVLLGIGIMGWRDYLM